MCVYWFYPSWLPNVFINKKSTKVHKSQKLENCFHLTIISYLKIDGTKICKGQHQKKVSSAQRSHFSFWEYNYIYYICYGSNNNEGYKTPSYDIYLISKLLHTRVLCCCCNGFSRNCVLCCIYLECRKQWFLLRAFAWDHVFAGRIPFKTEKGNFVSKVEIIPTTFLMTWAGLLFF